MANEVFVGIDVSKASLDIALRPSGERYTIPHSSEGIAELVDKLAASQASLIR